MSKPIRRATETQALLAEFLSTLRELPSSVPWTEDSARYYADGLRDVPAELLRDVLKVVRLTCDWRPTVAQLARVALEVARAHGLAPAARGRTAADAYAVAVALEARYGPYCVPVRHNGATLWTEGEPDWRENPDVGAAVRAFGGWAGFCAETNAAARRAHFTRAYNEAREGARLTETARLLAAPALGAAAATPRLEGGAPGGGLPRPHHPGTQAPGVEDR